MIFNLMTTQPGHHEHVAKAKKNFSTQKTSRQLFCSLTFFIIVQILGQKFSEVKKEEMFSNKIIAFKVRASIYNFHCELKNRPSPKIIFRNFGGTGLFRKLQLSLKNIVKNKIWVEIAFDKATENFCGNSIFSVRAKTRSVMIWFDNEPLSQLKNPLHECWCYSLSLSLSLPLSLSFKGHFEMSLPAINWVIFLFEGDLRLTTN